MSQEKLAKRIGLTFQQVQKYEWGANRVGASRLYQLAKILRVPVSFFFDDMPADLTGAVPRPAAPDPSIDFNRMNTPETREFVRAYHRIPDRTVRKRVYDLVKMIAAAKKGTGKTDATDTSV